MFEIALTKFMPKNPVNSLQNILYDENFLNHYFLSNYLLEFLFLEKKDVNKINDLNR